MPYAPSTGYDLGRICVEACAQAENITHEKLERHFQELEHHEEISKNLQTILNLVGKAKSQDSVDFSQNQTFLDAVEKIREKDSSIIDGLFGYASPSDYKWKKKEDVEALFQACNSAMRLQTAHTEKAMMRIQQLYQDRKDLFETGSRIVQDNRHLMEKILSQRG